MLRIVLIIIRPNLSERLISGLYLFVYTLFVSLPFLLFIRNIGNDTAVSFNEHNRFRAADILVLRFLYDKIEILKLNASHFSRYYLVIGCFLNVYTTYESLSFHNNTGESIINTYNDIQTCYCR